jgi:hypothetical protein
MNRLTGKGFVLAGVVAVLALAMPMAARAGMDVNISIPLFGLFPAERPVVMAPSPYGYVPNGYAAPTAGAVFYGGYWYLPSGGNWYIAAQAGGPWAVIGMERVPYAVVSGPVLMDQPRAYYGVPDGPAVGVIVDPWIFIGGYGSGRGHGHDD